MSTAIFKKLLEIKKKVPYLRKDKEGFNYSYTTPTAVLGTINPLLNEAGLLLLTNVTDSKSYEIHVPTKKDPDKKEWKFDLDFIFTWVDVETGERVDIPWKASGVNGEDKGLGSALTYAERYFFLKQFNIPTDADDPDGFQNKYGSEDDKKEIAGKKEAAAIAEISACKDTAALLMCWGKHKALQSVPSVIAAKDARKKELDVPWQPTQQETYELAKLIDESTMDDTRKESARIAVTNCNTPAEVAVIKAELLKYQPI